MKKQMKWGLATLILLLGIAAVFIFLDQNAELQQLEKETAESDKLRQEHNKPQETPPVQPPSQKAQVHADGSVHKGQHHDPIETEPSQEYNPSPIQIPEDITDPDVKAAWQRLDYISKNIWEWGGQFSPRAMELIDQLMPPPARFVGENAHSDAEAIDKLISELTKFRDPRAAVVMVTYMCEGIMWGTDMEDALVAIGPPSVPPLVSYLDVSSGAGIFAASRILSRIVEQYRSELDGAVEHIIIPRLEMIIADSDARRSVKLDARTALSRLKK